MRARASCRISSTRGRMISVRRAARYDLQRRPHGVAQAGDLEVLAGIARAQQNAAIERLQALRLGAPGGQAERQVLGHVLRAERHARQLVQTPIGEPGDPGDAGPQVQYDGAESRLVLAQAGEAGRVRGRDHRRDIEMATLDRRQEIVQGRAGHPHQVHRDMQAMADHAARIAQPGAVVQRDLHRQGMQNLAPLAARLRPGERQTHG